MIQRIQTIFLSIVFALSFTLCFVNILSFGTTTELFDMSAWTITDANKGENIASVWPIGIIDCIILVITVVTIFLYKKRILQIRLTIFSAILEIGFYILTAAYIYILKSKMSVDVEIFLHFPILLPLFNFILQVLAIRAIGKDEALVRSLNHLR